MNVEAEIRELKKRVDDLEGAFGVLTGQVRNVYPELTHFRTEARESFAGFGNVLLRVDSRLDDFLNRMGKVELQVWSMRDDLPELIRLAVDKNRDPPTGS